MVAHCIEVPPLSRKAIRKMAVNIREALSIDTPRLPIIEILEFILPQMYPDYSFIINDNLEMGDTHGLTYTNEKVIILKEDVYEGACNGKGRDRLTAAHEFSHLILHQNVPLARSISSDLIPAYRSSEWQANCLAGELLVSYQHIKKCKNYSEAAKLFGVSITAARYQWGEFEKAGLI